MTGYYFTRHGESSANIDGVVAGWSDVSLTDRGIQQARELSIQIAQNAMPIDLIVTSPLVRAHDTASIVAGGLDYPKGEIVVIDGLRERFAGTFELKSLEEVRSRTDEQLVEGGVEDLVRFRERISTSVTEIRHLSVGKRAVLIVGHAGVYRMIRVVTDGLMPNTAMYDIENPKNGALINVAI